MRTLLIILIATLTLTISYGQEEGDITTIILIRHAEKLSDGTNNPDLSPEGKDRALKLQTKFAQAGITAIYSTPYQRTMNTVTPLSKTLGIDIQEYNPSDKNFIQSIYRQNMGNTILVSGHSNTTPFAVNSLIGEEKYKDIHHDEYGRIFIVTISDKSKTSVLEIQY